MIRNFHFKMLIGIAIFAFALGFIFLFSGVASTAQRAVGPIGGLFTAVGLLAAITAGAIRSINRRLDAARIAEDPQYPTSNGGSKEAQDSNVQAAMANPAMPAIRGLGRGPLVAAIITLAACGVMSMGAASAAPAKPKVTVLKEWVGKSLEEVMKAYPARPFLNDDYPAINAAGDLRAAVVNTYPPMSAASKSVRIRELWWAQGNYYLTFLMHFKDGRWVVLAATKWHKDVRF
jgi:hypothetical protein